MKKNFEYICDKCEEVFDTEHDCLEHEKECGIEKHFLCDKCGKDYTYTNDPYGWESEGFHYFNLGRPGYGSGLDGCEVQFQICDDCLIGFIHSFTLEGQEKVLNSGSNCRMSSDQWIRYYKGEMDDDEKESLHMYSDRQIKSYKERYPVCKNVEIHKYKDGSCGSHCFYGAFGDGNGGTDHQPSTNCYQCEVFKPRNDGEEVNVIYHYKDED